MSSQMTANFNPAPGTHQNLCPDHLIPPFDILQDFFFIISISSRNSIPLTQKKQCPLGAALFAQVPPDPARARAIGLGTQDRGQAEAALPGRPLLFCGAGNGGEEDRQSKCRTEPCHYSSGKVDLKATGSYQQEAEKHKGLVDLESSADNRAARKGVPAGKLSLFGVLVVIVVHCWLLVNYMGGVDKLFSDEPLLYVDHSFHSILSVIGSTFLSEHGSTWGYDPYVLAGFPVDLADASDRVIKVGMVPALMFLSPQAAYKALVFLTAAVVPLLFLAGGAWFGGSRLTGSLSCALGTWVWWIGGGLLMFTQGMYGFPLASVYGLSLAWLFARYLDRPLIRYMAALVTGAALGLLIHPGILSVVGVPCFILYVFHIRSMPFRRHVFVFFLPVSALACNLFWVVPWVVNLRFVNTFAYLFSLPQKIVMELFINSIRHFQVILIILPVAAVAGLTMMARRSKGALWWSTLVTAACFFIFFTLGGFLPVIKQSQPLRFGTTLLTLLVFPASIGFQRWAATAFQPTADISRRVLLGGVLLLCVLSAFYFCIKPFTPPESFVPGPEPKIDRISKWLLKNTGTSARVMLQDEGPLGKFYRYRHSGLPIAFRSGREILANPGPATPIVLKHQFIRFSMFELFGRPLNQWEEKSLARYMDLYNVGWVGVHSKPARSLLEAAPSLFKPLGEAEGLRFYRVLREHSFFIEGEGEAEADYNVIRLRDVQPSNNRVVISYHWHPWFRADPPARVARVMKGADPVGFIGIENPSRNMELRIKRWWE